MILTWRLLYIDELVIHRFVLCCAASTVWPSGLCYTALIPSTQDKLNTGYYATCMAFLLSKCTARSSHVNILQEYSCFHWRKYVIAWKTKPEESLSTDGIWVACHGKEIHLGFVWCCMNAGCPASEGMQDILAIYIPFHIPSYVNCGFSKPFAVGSFLLRSRKNHLFRSSPPHRGRTPALLIIYYKKRTIPKNHEFQMHQQLFCNFSASPSYMVYFSSWTCVLLSFVSLVKGSEQHLFLA